MNKNSLYTRILESLGWFDAGKFEPLGLVNQVYPKNSFHAKKVIGYFPGCFAEFHAGHISAIQKFTEPLVDPLVVIAPSNANYTFEKYGDVEQASNKYRFDKIKSFEKELDEKIGKGNWCIDLNPMLNFDRDHNFTDLLEDFLHRHGSSLDTIEFKPYIICGKDRDYRKLETVTDKLSVFYAKDTTRESSSRLIAESPKPRKKKKLFLRVEHEEQYNLFKSWWSEQYESIEPIYLHQELDILEGKISKFTATCCKDYKHLLPYIHISRRWDNPLMQSDHWTDGHILNLNIVDSDIYTGSTRDFVESKGGQLYSIFDFSGMTDEVEVLDYNDFQKMEFCYPYTDISSRCSMQPFNKSMHEYYNAFREDIGEKS